MAQPCCLGSPRGLKALKLSGPGSKVVKPQAGALNPKSFWGCKSQGVWLEVQPAGSMVNASMRVLTI